jgi:predicted Zn-dependent peptidase
MPLRHTISEVQLKNGARGLLVNVPDMTVVSYDFGFRAGNNYVKSPKIQQTAHILEHLAFGANKKYDSAEVFSQVFSQNGASSNATTWDTTVLYYGTSAEMEWDRILDLWQCSITQPVFTEKALLTEKGNVREELEGQFSNHGRVLWQRMNRAAGGKSFLDSEKIATIDNVTLDDINEHYKRTHTLKNLRFVIAGDISAHRDAILAKMESWQLPAGERLAVVPATIKKGELVHIHREDMPNVAFRFMMGLQRELSVHERDAMGALNHILNGTFHSRIYGKARTRGICYGTGSDTTSGKDGVSEWEFYGQVSQKNAAELMALIVEQIREALAGNITERELNEAKSYSLGSLQLRGQTVGSLSDEYSDDFSNDEPIVLIEDMPPLIEAVSVAMMTDLANEFITAGLWTYGEIGTIEREQTEAHEQIVAQLFETR